MYRFLKSQGISLQSVCFASNPVNVQYSLRVCSFCKIYHAKIVKLNFLPTRNFATTVNTAEKPLQVKKKLRSRRKYTELLEVGVRSTSNKKASVQKLNAADLSELIKQPDLSLDKLHKIGKGNVKERVATKSKKEKEKVENKEILYESEPLKNDDLYETVTEYPNLDNCLEPLTKMAEEDEDMEKPVEKIKDKRKLKAAQKRKQKQEAKEEAEQKVKLFNEEFQEKVALSHLEVYVDCGMINRAERTLLYLRNNNLKTIKVYNTVLDAYAAMGNLTKVLQILELIKEDSLNPTPQTFAAVYECIGKSKSNEKHTKLLKEIKTYMNENKLTFSDIFKRAKFRDNQRHYVLAAIKKLEPDFQPTYDELDLQADCPLLRSTEINTKPYKNLPSIHELRESTEEQIKLECMGEVNIKSVGQLNPITDQTYLSRDLVAKFEDQIIKSATESFELNLKYLKQEERNSVKIANILSPFLEVLPKEVYIKSIIREIRQLTEGSANYSLTLSILRLNLGTHIYKKYELQTRIKAGILQKTKDIYMQYLDWYVNKRSGNNARITWELMKNDTETASMSLDKSSTEWPIKLRYRIGKFLYNIIMHDIKFDVGNKNKTTQKLPAFYTIYRSKGKFLREQVKTHPFLTKLYKDAQPEFLKFQTTILPCQVPPRPWTTTDAGGYIVTKSDFIRMAETNALQQKVLLNGTPTKQLYPVFDTLNQLGGTPWIINTKILDIIIEIFQNGGSEELNVPRPASALPSPLHPSYHVSPEERLLNAKHRLTYISTKNEMYSLWCDALYRLSLANHFRDKVFWLPHNLDFRGRVYPIPPHLHHLNSDLARSLLQFAEGKPLGVGGLDWLKIHTINLTGQMKKESIAGRLEYANNVLDDIIDSAENPLTGKMWWSKSDDPWQTLAACMEIAAVLKSPNPEEFVSHLPIHQDGSCNGLQHYAALGRDELGAKAVNLSPSEKPQDVYSAVASMVETARKADAKAGLDIAFLLDGYISRKVVKQTVMTTVYGVTKYGAVLQIRKQLKAITNFSDDQLKLASTYLANHTFRSLGAMFTGAKEIQDWLTDCANVISMNYNQYVQWVTPLGLPVIQAYSKKNIEINRYSANSYMLKPDTIKQRNAFAPNFVHSLDSSHMMLTSLHSEKEDITFVSVHDCYWTHVCTVNVMNKICREQFVALHSQQILENLAVFFAKHYGTKQNSTGSQKELIARLTNVPKKGNFDLHKVLSSVYFFS